MNRNETVLWSLLLFLVAVFFVFVIGLSNLLPKISNTSQFNQLEKYLNAEKWEQADNETRLVILKISGKENEGYLDDEALKTFSCEDITKIDTLWVNSSNKRFGFSIQKLIWLKVGGKRGYETDKKIGDEIGWRKDGKWRKYPDDYEFSLLEPAGYLPAAIWGKIPNTLRGAPGISDWLFTKANCL